jgi:hypothetical protein
VIGKIGIVGFAGNFPMAHDAPSHRLFVGCRRPAALLLFDDRSGKMLHSIPIDGDPDDVYYDPASRRIFVSCGAGFIDVLAPADSGQFKTVARLATGSGARTALLIPEFRRLYLAVPHHGPQRAEIRVFEVAPLGGDAGITKRRDSK